MIIACDPSSIVSKKPSGAFAWYLNTGYVGYAKTPPGEDAVRDFIRDLLFTKKYVDRPEDEKVIFYIERVTGFVAGSKKKEKKDGKKTYESGTSMFNLGGGYHAVRMAFRCYNIPVEAIHPLTWQATLGLKRHGLKSTPWKNKKQALAKELFPMYEKQITQAVMDPFLILKAAMMKQGIFINF